MQAFFRTYYHPSNASLAIAGDIDAAQALRARRAATSASMPGRTAGRAVSAPTAPVAGERPAGPRGSRRAAARCTWRGIRRRCSRGGDAELDLLADLLANGKTSRLYRTLVYERRVALDVSASQHSRELGSFFLLAATAAPGRTLAEIAAVIDREIQRLIDDGPTDAEIERGLAQAEAHFMYRLQTVGGFGGKSDQLNAYNVFQGDPGFFGADLARYRDATARSIQAAARDVLAFDRRVILSVVPRGQAALALPGSDPVAVS